jgi:hypothetical protein
MSVTIFFYAMVLHPNLTRIRSGVVPDGNEERQLDAMWGAESGPHYASISRFRFRLGCRVLKNLPIRCPKSSDRLISS